MDELRKQIKTECEFAVDFQQPLNIDPELRHVYVEILNEMMSVRRFISPTKPILDLLVQIGGIRSAKRRPGAPRIERWIREDGRSHRGSTDATI